MNLLRSMFGNKSMVGIDLGGSTVKVVRLEKASAQWKVTHLVQAETPVPWNTTLDVEAMSAVLRPLVKSLPKSSVAVTGVGSGAGIVGKIRLLECADGASKKDITELIEGDAETWVPYKLVDAHLSWQPLSTSVRSGMREFWVDVVPKNNCVAIQKLAEQAGISQPQILLNSIPAYVKLLQLERQPSEELLGLLDVGAKGNRVILSDKAQALKWWTGQSRPNDLGATLEPVLKGWKVKPARILVTGGKAEEIGDLKELGSVLGVPCERLKLSRIELPSDFVRGELAVGMALFSTQV